MRKNAAFTPEERADAREAFKILDGSGLSLADAARIAVGRSSEITRTTLDDAVNGFIRASIARNLRRRSVDFYEDKLFRFSGSFPETTLDDFNRPKLREWISAQGTAMSTAQGYLRAIRALFRWARRQDPPLCLADPTEGLALEAMIEERSVGIFTPEQTETIMEQAGPYEAAAALMLFAGIRPSEINAREKQALLWKHIDFEKKAIRIPSEIAKTRTARILEDLPANLWSWLKRSKGKPEAPICTRQTRFLSRHIQAAVNGFKWPQDGCRHSFATYHIAEFGSTDKTSLILGHEGRTSLLHQRYRGLCTKKEAGAFFAILPPKEEKKS